MTQQAKNSHPQKPRDENPPYQVNYMKTETTTHHIISSNNSSFKTKGEKVEKGKTPMNVKEKGRVCSMLNPNARKIQTPIRTINPPTRMPPFNYLG
jgi:hypothetical protein